MFFSSGNHHDRENALLWVMITQNETSPLVEKTAAKALISLVIATFHPAEPRRYCHISTSAMIPPGALTARLSSFLRNRPDKSPQMKPRRSRTQRAVLKPRSTANELVEKVRGILKEKDAKTFHGGPYAKVVLVNCYASGDGVAIDPAEAAKWFRKAAEQGGYCWAMQFGRLLHG